MSKRIKHYSEELKLSLIRSYYESGQSKGKFCKEHGLCDTSLLNYWLKTLRTAKKCYLCIQKQNQTVIWQIEAKTATGKRFIS